MSNNKHTRPAAAATAVVITYFIGFFKNQSQTKSNKTSCRCCCNSNAYLHITLTVRVLCDVEFELYIPWDIIFP